MEDVCLRFLSSQKITRALVRACRFQDMSFHYNVQLQQKPQIGGLERRSFLIAERNTRVSSVGGAIHIVSRFRAYLTEERKFSKHTSANYQSDLVTLACWLLGCERPLERSQHDALLQRAEKHLLEATNKQLQEFKVSVQSRGLEASTVARCIGAVRSFYKYLARKEYREDNPAFTLKMPMVPKKKRLFLSDEQVELLLAAVSQDQEDPALEDGGAADSDQGTEVLRLRDCAIFHLLVDTGLQLKKLVDLNLGDFDAENSCIKIRASGKTSLQRESSVSAECCTALQEYLAVRSGNAKMGQSTTTLDTPLFLNKHGTRLSDRSVRRKIEKWARRAGITFPISPRSLRYNFVARAKSKMDTNTLRDALGHRSRATTLDTVAQLAQI